MTSQETIFITGGSGEIGRPVVARLAAERRVRCAVRGDAAARIVTGLGAEPVAVDLFDAEATIAAASGAGAILHLATAIPPSAQMGELDNWIANDRLRAETTAHLAAAAEASGAKLVLQSYFGVAEPRGSEWIDEGPDRTPRWSEIGVMESMREAERAAAAVGAVILRCGSLYSETSEQLQAQIGFLRGGGAAIPGDGENFWPYLASEDAGRAMVAGLEVGPGTYDVGDDEPLRLREFWELAAATVGVPTPPHADVAGHPMAPILLGSWRTANRSFREASGWAPSIASARTGWPAAVARFEAARPGLRPDSPA